MTGTKELLLMESFQVGLTLKHSSGFHSKTVTFLIYISDLPGATSITKLYTAKTSFFAVAHDPKTTYISLNEEMSKISQQNYQWKLLFNPDTSRQALEIAFSCKKSITDHETIFFSNMPIVKKNVQKIWVYFLM